MESFFFSHGTPLSRAEDHGRAEFLCYCTDERRFFGSQFFSIRVG